MGIKSLLPELKSITKKVWNVVDVGVVVAVVVITNKIRCVDIVDVVVIIVVAVVIIVSTFIITISLQMKSFK